MKKYSRQTFSLLLFLGFYVLFLPCEKLFASSELVKGEVEFRVEHPIKTSKGLCKEIFLEQIRLKKTKEISLASPFVIVCDVAQIDTGLEGNNVNLRKALRFPEYKKITVQLLSVEKKKRKYELSGIITIGGVKRNYKSMASISKVANQINAKGRFSLKLSDFNIERPTYLLLKAANTVEIKYRFIINVK